jgi:outer membrane receptor protein involved in Fe transport
MYLLDNTESLFIGTRGISGGGIEFLVNGIPQHPSLQKVITATDINKFNIPVESIDRIEVIRGPMSVMYGNNAFQGVINIITNNASSQGSMASASIGTQGTSRQFARYAMQDQEKKYHITLNAGRYTTDGLSGDYDDMLSAQQLSVLYPGSDAKIDGRVPKEEKSLDLSAGYGDLELNIRHNVMHYGIYPLMPGIDDATYIDLETTHASLLYSIQLNHYWTWKTLGIYSQEEYTIPEFNIISPDFTGNQHQTSKRQELESTLSYLSSNLKTIFGYRYRYINGVENDSDLFIYDVMLEGVLDKLMPYKTHELFAQVNYRIDDNWDVEAGLRYSRLPEVFEGTRFYKAYDFLYRAIVPVDSKDQVSGRLALTYQINEHHNLRTIIGNAVQYRDMLLISDPEKIKSFELQHIMNYPKQRLQTNLFYNTISNIVQREVGLTGGIESKNAEWETYGIEMIGSFQFNKQWNASASLVYQNSVDTTFDIPVSYSPDLIFKIKTDYVDGPMIYSLNLNYIDEMEAGYRTIGSTAERIGEKVDDYFLVGANIRYAPDPNLYIDLKAENLFDEIYHYPANEVASMEKGLIGMGRVILLTVGYKF